jgi:hypothetical protein
LLKYSQEEEINTQNGPARAPSTCALLQRRVAVEIKGPVGGVCIFYYLRSKTPPKLTSMR